MYKLKSPVASLSKTYQLSSCSRYLSTQSSKITKLDPNLSLSSSPYTTTTSSPSPSRFSPRESSLSLSSSKNGKRQFSSLVNISFSNNNNTNTNSISTATTTLPHSFLPTSDLLPSPTNTSEISPFISRIMDFGDKLAVIDNHGWFTYEDLQRESIALAGSIIMFLSAATGGTPAFAGPLRLGVNGCKVAFLCPRNITYPVTLLAIWRLAGVAVPLSTTSTPSEIEYVLQDSNSTIVICHNDYFQTMKPITDKLNILLIRVPSSAELATLSAEAAVKKSQKKQKEQLSKTSNTAPAPAPAPALAPAPAPALAPALAPAAPSSLSSSALSSSSTGTVQFNNHTDFLLKYLSASSIHSDPALLIYTSGTTGKPKGVVLTHGNLTTQVCILSDAWRWSDKDRSLHVLPLHHVHGITNILLSSLWNGATCEMLPASFNAETVWKALSRSPTPVSSELLLPSAASSPSNANTLIEDWVKRPRPSLTVFMAVPTVYGKILDFVEKTKQSPESINQFRENCSKLRLMVSGSAALPVSILNKWKELSGHVLLERYGMSEIGMALSNPFEGERRPGTVGQPLPTVEVAIVDEIGTIITDPSSQGELLIRGPSVFKEYWNKPEATKDTFTKDGWFKTGDSAYFADGYYSIAGRLSVDIIKTGGFKVSALEIEEALLSTELLEECAVIGAPDEMYGQEIIALVVPNRDNAENFDYHTLRSQVSQELAVYKQPRKYVVLDALPRNAMGKVNKKELLKLYLEKEAQSSPRAAIV